ncbi:MAG: hypothetical protein HYV35_01200 [Lentisphaerae bacterium]|nr:hypothetical protein [Lentisphaerota bacterium]
MLDFLLKLVIVQIYQKLVGQKQLAGRIGMNWDDHITIDPKVLVGKPSGNTMTHFGLTPMSHPTTTSDPRAGEDIAVDWP